MTSTTLWDPCGCAKLLHDVGVIEVVKVCEEHQKPPLPPRLPRPRTREDRVALVQKAVEPMMWRTLEKMGTQRTAAVEDIVSSFTRASAEVYVDALTTWEPSGNLDKALDDLCAKIGKPLTVP
jgi:hypothetical protein